MQNEREAVREAFGLLFSQSQIYLTAIKETLMKLVKGDKSLTKKLKILPQEQGTMASIVTAVGLLISTIILAVTGGSGAGAVGGAGGAGNCAKTAGETRKRAKMAGG